MTCRLWLPALGFLFSCAPTTARSPETRWYKGNTHAHTLWDNGDALPEEVASWYRDRGYAIRNHDLAAGAAE